MRLRALLRQKTCQGQGQALRTPRPATGVSRALRARSVWGSVPESVPENGGCPTECLTGCLMGSLRSPSSVQKVSRESSRSVEKVFQTLRGYSWDTFWTLRSPGPEGRRRHSVRHSWRHPGFRGHCRDTPGDTWARRARETPVAGQGVSQYRLKCPTARPQQSQKEAMKNRQEQRKAIDMFNFWFAANGPLKGANRPPCDQLFYCKHAWGRKDKKMTEACSKAAFALYQNNCFY